MDEWTRTVYSDPAAARFVWGTAMHWYVSDDFAAPSRAHAAFPDKPTLFTEGCNDRHEEKGKFDLGKWEHGERYAHSMINDFRNWVCGWIDWNIVLDQTGGPNHVGNFCDSPVIVDTEKGEVRYASSFYYIGHFSRFVHPGARRIESHGGPAGLESVAFANPDGGLAVVVLNTGDAPADFQLAAGGGSRPCRIPARAIQTYVSTPGAQFWPVESSNASSHRKRARCSGVSSAMLSFIFLTRASRRSGASARLIGTTPSRSPHISSVELGPNRMLRGGEYGLEGLAALLSNTQRHRTRVPFGRTNGSR
jgi:hypothetical protein